MPGDSSHHHVMEGNDGSHEPSAAFMGDADQHSRRGTDAATTFPKFGELPIELRMQVWKESSSTVTRMFRPYGLVRTASCPPDLRCAACRADMNSSVASEPSPWQACRESRYFTRGKVESVLKTLDYSALWGDHSALNGPKVSKSQKFRFSPQTDMVVLDGFAASTLSTWYGPRGREDLLTIALDPRIPLVIDDGSPRLTLETINVIYHWYIKSRQKVYYLRHRLVIPLSHEGLQEAINRDLITSTAATKIVHLDDTRAMTTCLEAIMSLKEHCLQHRLVTSGVWGDDIDYGHLERSIEDYLRFLRVNDSLSVYVDSYGQPLVVCGLVIFKLHMADIIMESNGRGKSMGSEIMSLDGELDQDHPLVAQSQVQIPEVIPVIVFEFCAP